VLISRDAERERPQPRQQFWKDAGKICDAHRRNSSRDVSVLSILRYSADIGGRRSLASIANVCWRILYQPG
jgi:hypothetical protein